MKTEITEVILPYTHRLSDTLASAGAKYEILFRSEEIAIFPEELAKTGLTVAQAKEFAAQVLGKSDEEWKLQIAATEAAARSNYILPAATLWVLRWDDDEEVFATKEEALAYMESEDIRLAEIAEVIATGIIHEAHDYRRENSLLGTFAEASDAAAVVANLIAQGGTVDQCMVKPVEVYADTYNTPVAEIGE